MSKIRSTKKKSKVCHEPEITRRQFLGGAGAMGFSYSIMSPLLYGLMKHETAQAAGAMSDVLTVNIHCGGGIAGRTFGLPVDSAGNPVPQSLYPSHYGLVSNTLSLSQGTKVIGGIKLQKALLM